MTRENKGDERPKNRCRHLELVVGDHNRESFKEILRSHASSSQTVVTRFRISTSQAVSAGLQDTDRFAQNWGAFAIASLAKHTAGSRSLHQYGI